MTTPKKPSTLLAGHSLVWEGAAHDDDGRRVDWLRVGRAKCSCRKLSPVLPSKSARQRWHKEHKEQIRQAAADASGVELLSSRQMIPMQNLTQARIGLDIIVYTLGEQLRQIQDVESIDLDTLTIHIARSKFAPDMMESFVSVQTRAQAD